MTSAPPRWRRALTGLIAAVAASSLLATGASAADAAPPKRTTPLNVVVLTATTAADGRVDFAADVEVVGKAFEAREVAFAVRDYADPIDAGDLDPRHRGRTSWDVGHKETLTASTSRLTKGRYTVHLAWLGDQGWVHLPDTAYFAVGKAGKASSNELAPGDLEDVNGGDSDGGTVYVPPGGDDTGTTPAPSPSATSSPSATATASPRPTATATATPTATPTATSTATAAPSEPNEQPTTEPTKTTPPPPQTGTGGEFHATTIGASVDGAANGDFNRWTGLKHGMYSTWAGNGEVWAIQQPGSEYGANSVARLGDYDLDVALMDTIGSWSSPGDERVMRAGFEQIKRYWGDRQGHVYVRKYHEFNGDWYGWSTRTKADQEAFKRHWRTVVYPTFRSVFGDDPRFKLTWSPNWNSKYGLDVRDAFPGSDVVDVIGVDWYDWAKPSTVAAAKAAADATENGGSPQGLNAWLDYAAVVGEPVTLPEYGVQFGDYPAFMENLLATVKEHRYDGTGDPAGKILGLAYHNLRGKQNAVETGAGGDFYIQSGGRDYGSRPKSSAVLRQWVQDNAGWLRAAR